jgi:hypothetical protein
MTLARNFAADKAGNNIAAKIAMMAMTTSSSMSVNPILIEILLENWVLGFTDNLFLFARCAPVLQPLQICEIACRFWIARVAAAVIGVKRVNYSAITPLSDFRVAVGERNSDGAIVVSRGKIYPLKLIGKRITQKIAVIDRAGRLVKEHPAVHGPWLNDVGLFSVNPANVSAWG